MMNQPPSPINAVYAGIGRGHPNYLDTVLRYLRQHHPAEHRRIRTIEVPQISHGLSKVAWRAVERVYRAGSRGGIVSLAYTRLRNRYPGYDSDSAAVRLLGRDLLVLLRDYTDICLVAHPLLAAILQPDHRVHYLHGEIAAPRESAVPGVDRIYVPLAETKAKMVAHGIEPESIVETGLVLEPELMSGLDTTIGQRRQRIASGNPLTVGFFISGAYPRRHVSLMIAATRSCLDAGHRVRLFWGASLKEVGKLSASLHLFSTNVEIDDGSNPKLSDSQCAIVVGRNREEETLRSLAYLPHCDLFCAAPHERVNWAAGAGLPMVMIGPPIGSFAPENRKFVLRAGCGIEFSTPGQFENFAGEIDALRSGGRLSSMLDAGRRDSSIGGARVIAEDLMRSVS